MAIEETTRRQKAQSAIVGKNQNVRTLAILSAENPMGKKASEEENKEKREKLETYLNNANYAWFRIKGKYGNKEKSHIIYNISLEDAKTIGEMFQQESIIFVNMSDGEGKISYQYWETDGVNPYKMTHERNEIIRRDEADDFYSTICRAFKFQVPFFDGSDELKEEINGQEKALNELLEEKQLSDEDIQRYLDNILDEEKTGKRKWECRGNMYGGLSKWLENNK